MTNRLRDPYVIRVRRTTPPKADPKDGKLSWMAYGEDETAGIEVRIQTERGSLSLKVQRSGGSEIALLRAFQHIDFAGRKVGLNAVLWQGSIDGQLP